MPVSLVAVCNGALLKLGEARITSLEDGSTASNALAACHARVRRALLRAHPWSFAIARAGLAADEAAPAFGWSLQYTLPTACLRLVQVGEVAADPPPYEIEGGKMLTDSEAPLRVRYVADLEDAARWDPAFVEVMACALALEVCEQLTQSRARKADLGAALDSALASARRCNAIERRFSELGSEETWLRARYGSGAGVVAGTV